MRDGVRIAVDVWLPEDLKSGDRLPTIMRATRYWRAVDRVDGGLEADRNFAEAELFNDAGYALVIVDGRGSGASFGTRPYELSEEEAADYGEIADWIAAQSWSNQRIGAYGVSYAGNTAEMLAVSRRPVVKAVAPLFNDFDNFGHLIFPGGLLTIGFLEGWGETVHHMDLNDICAVARVTGGECEELKKQRRGVKPVDADEDGSLLNAAIQEHASNVHPYEAALEYEYRDDPWGEGGVRGVGYKRSPAGHLPDIEASGVPMLVRVGWLDAATVNGALGRYRTISNPQRVFIGPWDHGAGNDADPFLPAETPVEPTREEQNTQLLEFFDTFLKEDGSGSSESTIRYYTMGAGEWKETKVWPPEGFETERWYLGADGLLEKEPPQSEAGVDRYEVDFDATTGRHNRWFTNGGAGDVIYPDRSEEDKKLLTYTSAPMENDVEITGHPLITLYVTSTETDGAFIAYLEDVAPDGRVTYITEGQLRGVMRRVTDEAPPYKKAGPHRTELRADAMPLVPGKVSEITFELWATSVLIKKDHRIRVAVAGADKDSFLRYPKNGETPVLTIERNRLHASRIQLPMKSR
jgi:putative CocE/NonD family hydrolase